MKKHFSPITILILFSVLILLITQVPVVQAVHIGSQKNLASDYGVTLQTGAGAKTGAIGTAVSYTLTLKNTGIASDTFQLSCAGTWATTCQVDIGPVQPGETSKFPVKVAIPATAANGNIDTTTVTVTSTGDPAASASVNLTTTAAFARPLVMVSTYYVNEGSITPGQDFTLTLTLENVGNSPAGNLVLSFSSTDFYPRETGGVTAVSNLNAGGSVTISQQMASSYALSGYSIGTLAGTLNYTDVLGASYTEAFTFTINLKTPDYNAVNPTATPITTLRPQLVVGSYASSVDPLQPGSLFDLNLSIQNLGTADARAVTMVIGGTVLPDASGTPSPGGISGAGSDLANFAPIGSSNLVFIGDINTDAVLDVASQLIVNVTTQPGAYPLKLSFVYTDSKGNRIVDDQVITLLVYSLPQVEVSFYRDPGIFYTGQPNMLPLQVTNLGKKTAVLGNMKVTAQNAEMTNNISLVGTLDIGGYYTLDAQMMPMQAGTVPLEVTINYTDDFNQPREITQTLEVQVEEMPMPDPGSMGGPEGEGMVPEPAAETFFQKVLRFFKGLLGLGSGKPETNQYPVYEEGAKEGVIIEPAAPVP
ncbi:MAG TPA: hypothetical protein PK174_08005 [Anaerolineaceae bacterium]|nr:hypothetical protein [Anaerolineaceae bacterium]